MRAEIAKKNALHKFPGILICAQVTGYVQIGIMLKSYDKALQVVLHGTQA